MNFKKDFPIFKNYPKMIYLDSAATTQKPKIVIKSIVNFYEKFNSNINRGSYDLSEKATQLYEKSKEEIANFINAKSNEIVFTNNATEGFNFISHRIIELISKGKNEIVLSELEHNSNLVPWQEFAKKFNFKIKFIPLTKDFDLDYEEAKNLINKKTAFVSITQVSNVTGQINNIEKIISYAKKNNALTIVDATQSVSHIKVDVKKIDCDFLVFSGHKVFGPLGIGVLYSKEDLFKKLSPFLFGGGMVRNVDFFNSSYLEENKFEAGTQNISGVIALASALNFLNKNFKEIVNHEFEIKSYLFEKISKLDFLEVYSPLNEKNVGIISFNVKGFHCHDVASFLGMENIAVRAGHHCCMLLMKKFNLNGTCRASFSIYNTKKDVEVFVNNLIKIGEMLK
jgi:cysteine desulfurase / selenocysteine lyase